MTKITLYKQLNSNLKPKQIYVWDILIRLFHWSLCTFFFIAYVSEDDFLTIHSWAGYLIISLLVIRSVWGFIGSKYARFSNFIYRRELIHKFLKDTSALKAKRYIGHNPAGGAMAILLMLSILITVSSGMVIFGIEESRGPLASTLAGTSHFWGELVEELHEFFANFTLVLVAIHVAGVIVESLIHRENLTASMINGYKRTDT